jgi:hypothetical protein
MRRREEARFRFKTFVFIALITLAFGIPLISDALAGERVKARTALKEG